MSVRLKQRGVRGLVAVVALAAVTLVVLSGTVRAETTQNADRNDAREEAAATATPQEATYEPTERLVVEPGDSLWSIAQGRLGPNASPRLVANEVDRLYGLNRNVIGDDPALIFAGQEFSLPPVGKAAAAETAALPKSTDESLPESASEPVAPPASSVAPAAPTSSSEAVEPLPPSPNANEHWISILGRAHWLLGSGILFMTAILALFLAWKAFSVRRSLRRDPKLRYHAPSVEPGVPESEPQFPMLEAPGSKRSPSDLQSTTTAAENGHYYRVGANEVASIRRERILSARKRRWRKFLHEEWPTVVRARRVRCSSLRCAPLKGTVATNERATEATLEASRLSAKRKRKVRAAALVGSFARNGRAAMANGEQGTGKGPRKDLRDLEKKAGG